MTRPDDYTRLSEPRPVLVLHEGSWFPGDLEAYRRNPDQTWRGLVRYTTAPGATYLQWRNEPDLRPDDQPDAQPDAQLGGRLDLPAPAPGTRTDQHPGS